MHPRLDELLAFRDGEAAGDVMEHVASCTSCRATVEQCREVQQQLRALPALHPGRSVLAQVLEAAQQRRARRHWLAIGWAAASLTLAFTLTTAVRGGIETYREAKLARQTRELIAASQRIEQELTHSAADRGVVSGTKAAVIAELEDRIAAVDARLAATRSTPSDEIVDLWQQRVYLLGTLADVETTRTTYIGL